jgi:hypothetical protein
MHDTSPAIRRARSFLLSGMLTTGHFEPTLTLCLSRGVTVSIWRGTGFFILLFTGFLLALFSPMLCMRSMSWIYVIIPVMVLWVLWLMRVYQRWGRLGQRPW